MRAKFIFLVFLVTIMSMVTTNSQISLPVTRTFLSERDRTILNQHISEYTVFTIDKRELIDILYTNGTCQFRICIDEKLGWTIDLEFNDMRAEDFKQIYITNEGEFEWDEPFIVNTFKGKTSDGQTIRFTIDEDFFSGIILYDYFHYEIRPTKIYTQNSEDESLIVFKSWDLILSDDDFEYFDDALEVPDENENDSTEYNIEINSTSSITICPMFLKIATDADFQFYQARGSNLRNTYNHIFTVLNDIEGVYESTFDLKFIITRQFVFTTNTTYTSNDAISLLDQFRNHWNSNRKNVSRNIAHLFSGKTLNSWGVAWKGKIDNPNNPSSSSYAYALSMDRVDMYQTTAHEIGHNLDASDNPTNCSCGTAQASVMCQGIKRPNLWFCNISINEIRPFLNSNRHILTRIIPKSLNLSGTLTEFQSYNATQTITSNQVINSGFTSYRAGKEIVLTNGFAALSGSNFLAIIDPTLDCISPITVDHWSNSVCVGHSLLFYVSNATGFYASFYLVEGGGPQYSSSGNVSGNSAVIWNVPSDAIIGFYFVLVTFFNQIFSETFQFFFWVNLCSPDGGAPPYIIDETCDFLFSITPNPANEFITVDYNLYIDTSISIELFDMSGQKIKTILPKQNLKSGLYSKQTSVSDLITGTYLVKVTTENQTESKQLIINQ